MSNGYLASEVLTKDDLENIIRGIVVAGLAQPVADTPHNAAFRNGYLAAAAAIAVAVNIPSAAVLPIPSERLGRHDWPNLP